MAGLRGAVAGLIMTCGIASAALGQTASLPQAGPIAGSDWQVEVGVRAFFSGGRLQKTLFDPDNRTQLNSRLSYGGTMAGSGELFGRVDLPSGLFVKGYAGIGTHGRGVLQDEDYPPVEIPYSQTLSPMRSGKIDYGNLDIGYVFWRSNAARLGAFVGLHHFKEKYNGYGCSQVGGGSICAVPMPTTGLVLSETARWTALRVGLVADFALTDRLRLTTEAAFVPYAKLDAFDNHWLRPDINPMAENGQGFGAQFETSLAYQLTDHFSIGAGGRFWYLATTGAKTRFPGEANASPLIFRSERWGAFVQAAYKVGF